MRLINRGSKQSPLARQACDIALAAHLQTYGDYGRSKMKETYTVKVEGVKVWVEVVNRKASYVATAMTGMRRLRSLPGLKKILNGPNGQLERAMDDILVTSDLTSRYKISRKTLWSWQSADTMPRGFVCPFPPPDWPGNPNRWRSESIKEWEDKKKIN